MAILALKEAELTVEAKDGRVVFYIRTANTPPQMMAAEGLREAMELADQIDHAIDRALAQKVGLDFDDEEPTK